VATSQVVSNIQTTAQIIYYTNTTANCPMGTTSAPPPNSGNLYCVQWTPITFNFSSAPLLQSGVPYLIAITVVSDSTPQGIGPYCNGPGQPTCQVGGPSLSNTTGIEMFGVKNTNKFLNVLGWADYYGVISSTSQAGT